MTEWGRYEDELSFAAQISSFSVFAPSSHPSPLHLNRFFCIFFDLTVLQKLKGSPCLLRHPGSFKQTYSLPGLSLRAE